MEETSLSKFPNASSKEKLYVVEDEEKKKQISKKRLSAKNGVGKNKRFLTEKPSAENAKVNYRVLKSNFEKLVKIKNIKKHASKFKLERESSVEDGNRMMKDSESIRKKGKRDRLNERSFGNVKENDCILKSKLDKNVKQKKHASKNKFENNFSIKDENEVEKSIVNVKKNNRKISNQISSIDDSGKEKQAIKKQLVKNLEGEDREKRYRVSKNNLTTNDADRKKSSPNYKVSVLDKIYLDKLLEINRRREMIRNRKCLSLWLKQLKRLDKHEKRIKILKLSKIRALKAAKEYLNAEKARIAKDFKKKKVEMKNAIKADLLERKRKIQAEYLMCEIDESPVSRNLRKKSRMHPVANATFEKKRRQFTNVRIRLDENSIQNDIEAINAIINAEENVVSNAENNAILNAENQNENKDLLEESVFEKDGKLYYYGEWYLCGQKVKVRGHDFKFKGVLSLIENNYLRILKKNTHLRLAISFNHLISRNVIIEKRIVGKIEKRKNVKSEESESKKMKSKTSKSELEDKPRIKPDNSDAQN